MQACLDLDCYADYLLAQERSPITIRNYLSDLRSFSHWFADEVYDCTEGQDMHITPTDLRRYKRHLVEEREVKPVTVNRHLAALKGFLAWASENNVISNEQPPKLPRSLPESRPGPRWLDRNEKNALLRTVEASENERDVAIIRVLLNTGLRVAELCNVRWSDLHITARKGKVVVRCGKGRKRRVVPLNADARKALVDLGYGKRAGSPEPVFMGQRIRLGVRGVQFVVAKYGEAAKLEDVTPHVLRHTFCKDLIDQGAGLQEVAALAGHDRLETTRRYVEPSIKDLSKTIELISESE